MADKYVTQSELQDFMQGLLSGISDMMDEKIHRSENRIMAYIEAGVEKKVDILSEQVVSLTSKVNIMENHMAHMTERMDSIDVRLAAA